MESKNSHLAELLIDAAATIRMQSVELSSLREKGSDKVEFLVGGLAAANLTDCEGESFELLEKFFERFPSEGDPQ